MLLQLLFAVIQLPAGLFQLLLGIGQRAADGAQHLTVERVDLLLIQFDPDLAFHQAAAGDRGNAVHPLQRRNDRFGGKAGKRFPLHSIAAHRQHHNGQHIGIQLHQYRTAGAFRQRAGDLIQAGAHFDHGGIHAGAFFKFQHYDADVFLRNAGDVLDPAGGGQRRFQRLGHALLHLLRAGACVCGVSDDIGQVHAGQQVGGHIDKRHDAENERQHDADEDGHRSFDTEAGKHRAVSILGK